MEKQIKDLIDKLNKASEAYYNGREIMSNIEWDSLFDKLKALEAESGIILPHSPTQAVGSAPTVGTKVRHEYTARSLDKTKDVSQLMDKMSGESGILIMWKLDGGTLQLTYEGGRLNCAATRGNGEIGQDITRNAAYIAGIPLQIPYTGKLILRGEALMSYSDFEAINELLPEESRYANPRNLANATVSMLDPMEVKNRSIEFKAFGIVHRDPSISQTFSARMKWLSDQGFSTVDWELITPADIQDTIDRWTGKVQSFDYPVDGLVVASDNIEEAEALPGTAHHPDPRAGYAFKWADTEKETVLREIEWSASRTGLLNPVAIFDPVELEGTSVSRASLHNFSYMRSKCLRIGDTVSVYKANMIIPQIRDNISGGDKPYTDSEVNSMIPHCPICGTQSLIHTLGEVETIHCKNPHCAAKRIGRFTHFVSRNCMDIEGMSDATITKFVELGFLHDLGDIYRLDAHAADIINLEGFGEKSWNNLWDAIQKSRTPDIIALITSLGITGIGRGQAGIIAKYFSGNADTTLSHIFKTGSDAFDFTVIDGMGGVLNDSIHSFADMVAADSDNYLGDLLSHLSVRDLEMADTTSSPIAGKTFVVTGSVSHFANRDELKAKIESLGGKVTGSVTKKTDYLINNDITSTSGKNKKAQELNIPIISEEMFIRMMEGR